MKEKYFVCPKYQTQCSADLEHAPGTFILSKIRTLETGVWLLKAARFVCRILNKTVLCQ